MKKNLLFMLMCLVVIQVQAQSLRISGTIKDEIGEPAIGAGVMVKGTTIGAVADIDGNYSIEVPANAKTLVVSHVVYKTQEVDINRRTIIDIVLTNEAQQLGEVVVTALGIKRDKKALGYSVQSVDGESLNTISSVSPLNALAGAMSGLNVSTTGSGPGGSVKMIIRGANSLTGSNEPLYVIDGVPLDNTIVSTAGESGGFDFGNAANNINPADIENISVLKGGAAAALYGSRGQNGVIMITTKQGKQGGKLEVNYKTSYTFSQAMMKPNFQKQYAQGASGKHVLSETQSWGPKMQGQSYTNFLGQDAILNENSENPFKEFYQTGNNFDNTISIKKGLDKGSFYLSGSYLNSNGIVPKEKFNKLNLNLRVNYDLTKYLTVDTKFNIIDQTGKNRPNLMNSPDNTVYALYHLPRSVTVGQLNNYKTLTGLPVIFNKMYHYNDKGNLMYTDGDSNFQFAQSPYVQNPFWTTALNTNEDNRKRMLGFVKFDVNILNIFPSIPLDNLSLMVRGGADYYADRRREQVYDKTIYKPSGTALLRTYKGDMLETNFDILLSGLKKFNDFSISASVGSNIRNNKWHHTTANSESGIINPYGDYVIQNFNKIQSTEGITEREIQSVYGMFTADYKGMLFLDVTARNDWTSTLSPNNRSFFYPSFSFSWIISETFNLPKAIGYLKARASWAEVGSDVGPGQIYYNYTINSTQYYGYPYGGIPSVKPNFNILPEKTRSTEFGVEGRFLSNRLRADLSYYQTGTKNQIFSAPQASSSGFESARINAGHISNKGIEISLSGDIIKNENFILSANINASRNFANVKELTDEMNVLTVGGYGGVGIQVRPNEAPGLLTGTSYLRDAAGNSMLDDKNLPIRKTTEAGSIDDQSILGNCMPKWIGGAGLNFDYKGFVGSIFVDGKFGHKMFSYSNLYASKIGVLDNTIDGRDNWEVAKTAAAEAGLNPRDIGGKVVNGSKNGVVGNYYADPQEYYERLSQISEEYIYDASFIRLQRISLGYRFSKGLVERVGIRSITLSAVASNLFYIMKHTPNVTPTSAFTSGTFGGVEMFAYPELRNFGFSLSFDF